MKGVCKRGHVNPARSAYGVCIPCRKLLAPARYQQDRARKIAYAMEYEKRDPDAHRDRQRASRLGVPVAEVRRAIRECEGKCEACATPLTNAQMCLDHCHETGAVRGVLCRFCNALEGMLNKKKERVEQVLAYVNKKKGGAPTARAA